MAFEFIQTPIDGLKIVQPKRFGDERGFFEETYTHKDFAAAGIAITFVQDNHSCSKAGVLRGIHFQKEPKAQAKFVSVIKGAVIDVAVDLRKDSSTFKQHFAVELSAENGRGFYIPAGFGHAFITLEDDTHFCYKCSNYYSKEHDGGIVYNDSELNIDWKKYYLGDLIVSEKDRNLPKISEVAL